MAWVTGASERRIDGDRITEMVKAKDWLAGHETRGPEVNPLTPLPDKPEFPPALPMYMSRDHLHDRNRQNALYDPAQPGLETYVRVTRRRAPPEAEAYLQEEARKRAAKWQREEARQTSEAFELLELRSLGVRAALEAGKTANQRVKAGEWTPSRQPSPPKAHEKRAEQLHKKLGIDKVKLVTSPLHIDDTPGGYWSADGSPDPNLPPPPPRATAAPKGKLSMRGGAWPSDSGYFTQTRGPPKKVTEELHNKGAYAPSSMRAGIRPSA